MTTVAVDCGTRRLLPASPRRLRAGEVYTPASWAGATG